MLSMERSVDKDENTSPGKVGEDEEGDESESDTEDGEEKKATGHVTAFIPFADMLNYRPNDVCGGDMTDREDFFRVWSSRGVEKGKPFPVLLLLS
jgi:CRISPR/Cas system CMR-associated protein Cmr3 (group 5 of RAMP superfamily)